MANRDTVINLRVLGAEWVQAQIDGMQTLVDVANRLLEASGDGRFGAQFDDFARQLRLALSMVEGQS